MQRDIAKQVEAFLPQLMEAADSPFDAMMLAMVAAIAMAKADDKPCSTLHEAVTHLWKRVDAGQIVWAPGRGSSSTQPD